MAWGCGDFVGEPTSKISECGGLEAGGDTLPKARGYSDAYCDAEVLHWLFDTSTQTLTLTHARVAANCCGDHSLSVKLQEGVYVVTEVDKWKPPGRCRCICVYDYTVDIPGVSGDTVEIKLVREVIDPPPESESFTVWEGSLDLSEGEGWFIIDETPVGANECPQ
jgi:hypothetical protein